MGQFAPAMWVKSTSALTAGMLPYPYPHWKEHIRYAEGYTAQSNPCIIKCVFCDGYGKRPATAYQAQQRGTVEHPRTQFVGEIITTWPCPVCLGHKELAVIPDTEENPWIPCAQCETYGRILGSVDRYVDRSAVREVSSDTCETCRGLGFTVASQSQAYTGDTKRLHPLD